MLMPFDGVATYNTVSCEKYDARGKDARVKENAFNKTQKKMQNLSKNKALNFNSAKNWPKIMFVNKTKHKVKSD